MAADLRLLASDALLSQSSSSNSEASKSLWNKIWKLHVPNRVRHFLWRACSESLPTKRNLHIRHVAPTSECNLCGEFPEDAIFEDSELAGLGVVIRDSAGLIIAAHSHKIRLPSSVDLVEAMAASRALSFAREISIFQVEVEGDSLKVIQAVNKLRPCTTMFGQN